MDQTFRLNLFICSSISLRVPVSWMDCGGKGLLPELLRNLDPPVLTNLRALFVHSYARSCHNSTKTTTHKTSNHGHRQVHRRRLPRRSGRQRRHSSRSAPPALLRRNCRLRAQLAGYRPREFYLQHGNESRSQHLDTNSANDMSGVKQASMCSMRLLFSDIKLHWHCFRPIN